MKDVARYGLLIVLLAITPLGLIAHAEDEERVIPIEARSDVFPKENTAPNGEPCRLIDNSIPGMRIPYQITVTGANGDILAMESLKGELVQDDRGDRRCVVDLQIAVPENEFYVVYLGEQRILGYSEDEFPIPAADSIVLMLD